MKTMNFKNKNRKNKDIIILSDFYVKKDDKINENQQKSQLDCNNHSFNIDEDISSILQTSKLRDK